MRAILVAFSCSVALLAQVDTGVVSGVVTDRSGAVIPGATITITRLEINSSTELLTNESGFYSASALRPGRYEISVAKEGFRSQKSQPFDVHVQDRTAVTFQLDVAAAEQSILVKAVAPSLESETSSLGHVVEEKTVSELPLNGRNFIQLAILGAGTLQSRTSERDNFISNGARALQKAICSTVSTIGIGSWVTPVQHKSCSRSSIPSRSSKSRLPPFRRSLGSPPAEW